MVIRGPPALATASRPAMAMMSAQDTLFGQASSSVAFTPSMMSSFLILKLEPASNTVVIPLAESSITDASHPCAGEYPGFNVSIVDDQHESCGKIWAATERKQNLRMYAWYAILEPHIACCGTSETGVLQILTGRRLGPQANPRGKKNHDQVSGRERFNACSSRMTWLHTYFLHTGVDGERWGMAIPALDSRERKDEEWRQKRWDQ